MKKKTIVMSRAALTLLLFFGMAQQNLVQADSGLNEYEQSVLMLVESTYTIEGQAYIVDPTYQSAARKYLESDGIDLNESQYTSMVAEINEKLTYGVTSGYLILKEQPTESAAQTQPAQIESQTPAESQTQTESHTESATVKQTTAAQETMEETVSEELTAEETEEITEKITAEETTAMQPTETAQPESNQTETTFQPKEGKEILAALERMPEISTALRVGGILVLSVFILSMLLSLKADVFQHHKSRKRSKEE